MCTNLTFLLMMMTGMRLPHLDLDYLPIYLYTTAVNSSERHDHYSSTAVEAIVPLQVVHTVAERILIYSWVEGLLHSFHPETSNRNERRCTSYCFVWKGMPTPYPANNTIILMYPRRKTPRVQGHAEWTIV